MLHKRQLIFYRGVTTVAFSADAIAKGMPNLGNFQELVNLHGAKTPILYLTFQTGGKPVQNPTIRVPTS